MRPTDAEILDALKRGLSCARSLDVGAGEDRKVLEDVIDRLEAEKEQKSWSDLAVKTRSAWAKENG